MDHRQLFLALDLLHHIPVGLATLFAVAALVEDPPWVLNEPKRGIDSIGLGLIALGLGSLQVMLDRGEDDDCSARTSSS